MPSIVVKAVGTPQVRVGMQGPQVLEECGEGGEPISLRAYMSGAEPASPTQWAWSLSGDCNEYSHCAEIQEVLRGTQSENAKIPTELLATGRDYTVSVSASSLWGDVGTATLHIRKLPGRVPRVWLMGATDTHYAHRELVLEGAAHFAGCEGSFEPVHEVIYEWSVEAKEGFTTHTLEHNTRSATRLVLPAHSLRAGAMYNISLRAWAASRPEVVGVASIKVRILAPPLVVSIIGGSRCCAHSDLTCLHTFSVSMKIANPPLCLLLMCDAFFVLRAKPNQKCCM
jgi:hypothetical protein